MRAQRIFRRDPISNRPKPAPLTPAYAVGILQRTVNHKDTTDGTITYRSTVRAPQPKGRITMLTWFRCALVAALVRMSTEGHRKAKGKT